MPANFFMGPLLEGCFQGLEGNSGEMGSRERVPLLVVLVRLEIAVTRALRRSRKPDRAETVHSVWRIWHVTSLLPSFTLKGYIFPHPGGLLVSIVRIGLAETKKFAEGYQAIFGKPKNAGA